MDGHRLARVRVAKGMLGEGTETTETAAEGEETAGETGADVGQANATGARAPEMTVAPGEPDLGQGEATPAPDRRPADVVELTAVKGGATGKDGRRKRKKDEGPRHRTERGA